jgi:hypothetical protein
MLTNIGINTFFKRGLIANRQAIRRHSTTAQLGCDVVTIGTASLNLSKTMEKSIHGWFNMIKTGDYKSAEERMVHKGVFCGAMGNRVAVANLGPNKPRVISEYMQPFSKDISDITLQRVMLRQLSPNLMMAIGSYDLTKSGKVSGGHFSMIGNEYGKLLLVQSSVKIEGKASIVVSETMPKHANGMPTLSIPEHSNNSPISKQDFPIINVINFISLRNQLTTLKAIKRWATTAVLGEGDKIPKYFAVNAFFNGTMADKGAVVNSTENMPNALREYMEIFLMGLENARFNEVNLMALNDELTLACGTYTFTKNGTDTTGHFSFVSDSYGDLYLHHSGVKIMDESVIKLPGTHSIDEPRYPHLFPPTPPK